MQVITIEIEPGPLALGQEEQQSEVKTVKKRLFWMLLVFATISAGLSWHARALSIPVTSQLKIPTAPSHLTAEALGSTSIHLGWQNNAADATGFKIERNGAQIQKVLAETTTYTDTGLTPGTTYTYRVRAYNYYGDSAASNPATAATRPALTTAFPESFQQALEAMRHTQGSSQDSPDLPTDSFLDEFMANPPSGLTATALTSSAIKLSWDYALQGYHPLLIFIGIERNGEALENVLPASSREFIDTNLEAGETYYYRVVAAVLFGPTPVFSGFTNYAAATTLPAESTPQAPLAPAPVPAEPGQEIVIRFYIGKTEYYVNETLHGMDVAPLIREGRTLMPVRYIAENLGSDVSWNAAEQKAAIAMGDRFIELWIGSSTARVNGQPKPIDSLNPQVVPVIIPPGRTMLPLRFIAENLGCKVQWNAVLQEVTITYPSP